MSKKYKLIKLQDYLEQRKHLIKNNYLSLKDYLKQQKYFCK